MMKIPIILLCKERPDQLRAMVDRILQVTDVNTYNLIIVDNSSEDPRMKDLLGNWDYYKDNIQIIYNSENQGFMGLEKALKQVYTDYFLLSDPDILLNGKTPSNWIQIFIDFLKENPLVPKVGNALDIWNFKEGPVTSKIKSWESNFWKDACKYQNYQCYYAAIDTTMVMYRKDTYKQWEQSGLSMKYLVNEWYPYVPQTYNSKYISSPVRFAGDFTAQHLGWYPEDYVEDFDFYKTHCNLDLSSSVKRFFGKGYEGDQ